jgi:hypothetical protein
MGRRLLDEHPVLVEAIREIDGLLADLGWPDAAGGSLCDELRRSAMRLLDLHALLASDALQLAAALACCDREPGGFGFVCLDEKLRAAALSQGFEVLPARVATGW